jgi:hypothetical protein
MSRPQRFSDELQMARRGTVTMSRSCLRGCLRRALLIAALGGVGLADAQQPLDPPPRGGAPEREQSLDYALVGRITGSDNIRRSATDEEGGAYSRTGLLLGYQQRSQRLDASVNADLGFEHYFDNAFGDSVVGGLDGVAVLGLVPERFEWHIQDNFGQVTSDPFVAITPETRENANYFTTGPDVLVRLGSALRLRLNGRYSNVSYEKSPFDNKRLGGGIAVQRELSSAAVASLNVRTEKTKHDDDIISHSSDYQRREASLGLAARGARTRANLEVGYTELSFADTDQQSDGLLVRLGLDRQLTRSSTLSLTLGREFSSAGDIFRLQQQLASTSQRTLSVLPTSDPFTNQYASLRYEFLGRRSGLGFGFARFKESYDNVAHDERQRSLADVQVHRDLRANLRVRLRGGTAKEDARNLPDGFHETGGMLGLSWQTGARLFLDLELERIRRDSDREGGDYTENRAWLGVRYGSVPAIGRTTAWDAASALESR